MTGLPASTTTLVTGGAGFMGSAVVRELLRRTEGFVVVLDALTHAGGRDNLPDDPRVVLIEGDVADEVAVRELFETDRPARVLHLAAVETVRLVRAVVVPGQRGQLTPASWDTRNGQHGVLEERPDAESGGCVDCLPAPPWASATSSCARIPASR